MALFELDVTGLHDAVLRDKASRPVLDGLLAPAPPRAAHGAPAGASASGSDALAALVTDLHQANLAIWILEDEARRRDVGDERIAAVKRAIDPWNQRRNDLMEAIDAVVLARLEGADTSGAELHSETAGMMVDRLSVLALKIDNVQRILADPSTSSEVLGECLARVKALRRQRADLDECLARLLEDFAGGRRYFRPFRQLKSYNDPRLNPALRSGGGGGK